MLDIDKKYVVIASPQFEKDLKKLPIKIAQSTIKSIEETLIPNPFFGKKLTNMPAGEWRIRIGKDYRLRYDILEDKIYLYRIMHRKDIYKKH